MNRSKTLTEEFKSGFICDPPGFMPEDLAARLFFESCLATASDRMTFRVFDRETNQKAVLKIAFPGSANNLAREHEILYRLSHPAIPAAIRFERDAQGREYLLRSYAEGETLSFLLERDGVFTSRRTLEIAEGVCMVLSYLHQQTPPLVYRDISPSNIVITAGGKLSLIDFGISREIKKHQAFDTEYLGSLAFTSPENMGFAQTDPRSDIFSLGRLMLYLSSGDAELPHYEQRILSAPLRKIIGKCTRLSPEKRYRSVARLQNSIRRALYPPTRKELSLMAAVMALTVGLGLFVFLRRMAPPPAPVPKEEAVSADGAEAQDEAKIPVMIETKKEGRPFSDCVVAIDSHHWYQPDQKGRAELLALGYQNYRVQASSGNRSVFIDTPVTRDAGSLKFVLDIAEAPAAPDYLTLSFPYGAAQTYPLGITSADTVTLSGQPQGISAVKTGDEFYLAVDENVPRAGHYTVFLEAENARGRSTTALSLLLNDDRAFTLIHTPQELDRVRYDLSGHYKLANDIDLAEFDPFTPIGNEANPFTGIFDGGGFSVTGLSLYGSNSHTGLFGQVTNGVIKNLVISQPRIRAEYSLYKGAAALVGLLDGGLIDSCAVIGGSLDADLQVDAAAGGLCGISFGAISGCFNSARIAVTDNERAGTGSQAGGIAGENTGYIADCGNTGDISGPSIAGGITSYSDRGIITRCYNAGMITAPDYLGVCPAGGIAQLMGRGRYISYCAFERGTASVGASVWATGPLIGIVAADRNDFKDIRAFGRMLRSDKAAEIWTYSDLVPGYPVPAGIFKTISHP